VKMYLKNQKIYDFAHKNNSIFYQAHSITFPNGRVQNTVLDMYFFIRNEKPNQEKQNSPSKLNDLNVDGGFQKEKEPRM